MVTTNPETWINRYRDKHYKIFSFILKTSIDTCLEQCRKDEKKKNRDKRYEELDQHEIDHKLFYKDPNFVNFAKKTGIFEEIIDTEMSSIPEIVNIIYKIIPNK
jgi:hypothetical protein